MSKFCSSHKWTGQLYSCTTASTLMYLAVDPIRYITWSGCYCYTSYFWLWWHTALLVSLMWLSFKCHTVSTCSTEAYHPRTLSPCLTPATTALCGHARPTGHCLLAWHTATTSVCGRVRPTCQRWLPLIHCLRMVIGGLPLVTLTHWPQSSMEGQSNTLSQSKLKPTNCAILKTFSFNIPVYMHTCV